MLKLGLMFSYLIMTVLSHITLEKYENMKSKATFEMFEYGKNPLIKRGVDLSKLTGLLSLITPKNYKTVSSNKNISDSNLPENFDARQKWPDCIHRVRNQGACGSCWSYAVSGVMSDRFCIASNGKVKIELTPQDLVSCDDFNKGCNGGTIEAFTTSETQGITTELCMPYQSSRGEEAECKVKCLNPEIPFFRYRSVKDSTTTYKDQVAIKNALFKDGPLWVGMKVEQDLFYYSGGIYVPTEIASTYNGHAVKLVGWGVEGDVKYWIIQNSWGSDWGENGYFRIKMGECRIESQITAALPDLTWLPPEPKKVDEDDWDDDDLSK